VFGLEIDHRIVSVAQFGSRETTAAHPGGHRAGARARVASVRFDTEAVRARSQVVLVDSDEEYTGFAEGSVAAVARPYLVASAALDALRQMDSSADAIHLAAADVIRVGKNRIAVVTVVYVEPQVELPVSGSAIVRRDRDEAVARALLDATNRRMSRLEPGQVAR
jgi:hypothetical protein